MEIKFHWICGLFALLAKDVCCSAKDPTSHVLVLENIEVQKGSCVILPCKYRPKDTNDISIRWLFNATYNHARKDYEGKVAYSKNKTEIDNLFTNHVKYVGTVNTDCTIEISNIQKEHEGLYILRIWGKGEFKWVSKNVTITVSDFGPALNITHRTEMKESERVTVTCSINHYCSLTNISLYWIEEVNGTSTTDFISNTEQILTRSSLNFQPSWKDNGKNITCVLDQDEEKSEKTVQLNVQYAPKNVQIFPNNTPFKIRKTEPLTLNCSVESSNPPKYGITWFKGNKPLQNKNGIQLTVSSSGKYYCKANNIIGSTTSGLIDVSVLYPPEKIQIKSQDNIKEGMNVTLECSTKAEPPVNLFIWSKDNQEIYNHTTNKFTILNIKENDSGLYTCLASNELGNTKSDKFLDVLYAPRHPRVVLSSDNITSAEDKVVFVEGSKVTYQCNVSSSNPNDLEITWYKNEKKIQKLSWVANKEDAGKYTCKAENAAGYNLSPVLNVDIHYPPKDVSIEVPGKNVKEHDRIRLKCLVKESRPIIREYHWYKDGVLFKSSTSYIMELQLEWTHTGKYSCEAVNEIGPGKSTMKHIDVQYAPKNVTLSVIPGDHITEFMDITLICSGKGNPAGHYSYYVNNKQLSIRYDNYNLINVQKEDTGEYYCLGENDVGYMKSNVVHLHVSYSLTTIERFALIGVFPFIILIILIILIVRFRIRIRNGLCRKTVDDKSDSSFFVLKKSHNESADNMGHQTPPLDSSTDHLNYSNLNFPVPSRRQVDLPSLSSAIEDDDVITVYSVVQKVPNVTEYENIDPSKRDHEDSQDEIHYSVIANLNKKVTEREHDPEVEYAKLRHS